MNRKGKFYVYILKCVDGSFYTGSTKTVNLRLKQHNLGHGAKSIKNKLPVQLVFVKEYTYYKNALQAEKKFKKYSRTRKEELIQIYDQSIK